VPEQETKRSLSGGLTTRTWDPATGKYISEEIPGDVQELMGIKKRKVLTAKNDEYAWGGAEASRTAGGVLSAASGKGTGRPAVKQEQRSGPPAPIKEVDKSAPSVEYHSFSKVELNDRYYERSNVILHGRPTWWNEAVTYFIYWQGEVQRWAICDASSFTAVKSGQYPGWAYKEDHRHLALAGGWMEAFNGTWQQPDLTVITRSYSSNKAQWSSTLVKSITEVEFRGFAMQELNTRYMLNANDTTQGGWMEAFNGIWQQYMQWT
jgi:hypothetical protein